MLFPYTTLVNSGRSICPSMMGVEVLTLKQSKACSSALALRPPSSSPLLLRTSVFEKNSPLQQPKRPFVCILRPLLERSFHSREFTRQSKSYDDGGEGEEGSCYDEDFGAGVFVPGGVGGRGREEGGGFGHGVCEGMGGGWWGETESRWPRGEHFVVRRRRARTDREIFFLKVFLGTDGLFLASKYYVEQISL